MNVDQAKQIAEKHFPQGPETLAKEMGIAVHHGQISGCDGWVLKGPVCTVIRINSESTNSRRRFTLAHELGHLLLGIPTVVGENLTDSLKSDDKEERKVNDLAAELLLPEKVVRQYLPSVPVVAAQLKKLANQAKVSELAAAIRVANLAKEIGLVNASVAFFKNDRFEWQWSRTLTMTSAIAAALLKEARKVAPQPARVPRKDRGDIVVASLIENPLFNSVTLFVQLLPKEAGNQLSITERRQQLEEFLFKDDNQFRMQLQGVFGSFRAECNGLTLDAAVALFFKKKWDRWEGSRRVRINSEKGREYVRLRLREWCS